MIEPVPTSTTAFVGLAQQGPVDEPTSVTSFADFSRVFGGLSTRSTMSYAVRDYFLNGGSEAVVVRASDAPSGDPADAKLVPPEPDGTGLYALDGADLFNLLCVPAPVRGADLAIDDLAAATAYCARRRALLLVDPPASWEKAADVVADVEQLDLFTALTRENAALYFPGIRSADPESGGAVETFPPCGAVAGIIARTDAARGVWRAPAGQDADIRGIDGLAAALTGEDAGALAAIGINPLRTFPAVGAVVWGARTLAGEDALGSDWKYLPVRRLALFLEESIDRGTRWAVFEPNDELLWARIRTDADAFMHDLFLKGAFQGITPDRAYFVKCDAETTTQADVHAGIVNILVGFAPLKPAEFVLVRIRQALAPP